VVVTKDDMTIVEGGGKADEIQGRVNQLKASVAAMFLTTEALVATRPEETPNMPGRPGNTDF
jgi:hypothetical protein